MLDLKWISNSLETKFKLIIVSMNNKTFTYHNITFNKIDNPQAYLKYMQLIQKFVEVSFRNKDFIDLMSNKITI